MKYSTSYSQFVGSIDDLLIEILLRLPVKSLIRFKTVSKQWLSLITSSEFSRRRKANPVGLVVHILGEDSRFKNISLYPEQPSYLPLLNLGFANESSWETITESCNGLFLCYRYRFRHNCGNDRHYYVYNPTINQLSLIPKIEDAPLHALHEMNLVFDPSKSPHYKIVSVQPFDMLKEDEDSWSNIRIYSSETRSWRLCRNLLTKRHLKNINLEDGVYWNGSVHWIARKPKEHSLLFHVDYELLHEMPTPPVHERSLCHRGAFYLGESCGHLHFIGVRDPRIRFNVYEMKRGYSEWFVRYEVDLSHVVVAYPEIKTTINFPHGDCTMGVFFVVRGEEEKDSFLVLQIPGRVIKYNLVDKDFVKLHEFDGTEVPRKWGIQYIESLCCV